MSPASLCQAWRPAALLLAIAALNGCVGDRSPTDPLLRPQLAVGDVFTVTNTNDAGPGSLRQALADATPDATITFATGLAGATISLQTPLAFAAPLTIEGPPDGGITLDGRGVVQVLDIASGPSAASTATLRNLTVTNGRAVAGGGIRSAAALQVEHTTISGNVATGSGGGIYTLAALTLVNSTVSGNAAADFGGGISAADLDVVTLVNSTIAYNEAEAGGGVSFVVMTLENSVLANNTAVLGASCFNLLVGVPTLSGRSIASDVSCGPAGPALLVADPLLEALADNGGPSPTHALRIFSPAIDAALSCSVTVDQRYLARPQGAACDIGAHEFDAYLQVDLVVHGSVTVNPNNGVAVMTGSVSCPDNAPFDLHVGLVQPQKAGRVNTIVQATATVSINCANPLEHWSAALVPATGGFRNGTATANVATANTGVWIAPGAVSKSVKLFWGHK